MTSRRSSVAAARAAYVLLAAASLAACGGQGGSANGESPTGLIAYESYQPNNLDDIYVMNADGTGKKALIAGPEPEWSPAWSPDGTKIAFVNSGDDGSEDIHVIKLDGTYLLNLTAHPAYLDRAPTWSPDGRRIAFISSRDWRDEDGTSVYVMNEDGTAVRRLTDGRHDSDPAWSPDGTRIAFERDSDLYAVSVDDSQPSRLTRTEALEFSPAWSPDGERIAFHRDSDTSDRGSYYENNDEFAIWVMSARGGAARPLFPPGRGPPGQSEPAWSPDGKWIAFRSHRAEDSGEQCESIYVARVDGTKLRQVTRCTRRWGAGHWLDSADHASWGVDAEPP